MATAVTAAAQEDQHIIFPHTHVTTRLAMRGETEEMTLPFPENSDGKPDDDSWIRSTYLSCLGAIFLIAFWSYYSSFPGLLSSSGIEPVGRLMPYVIPSLFDYENADSFCQLAAVFGMLLSCIAVSGIMQHGLLFATLTLLYSILTRAGGTFYSFQWDTLLLETGMLTAVCYAPWTRLHPTSSSRLGAFPLQFLLFKLMYMSGVVKIQSGCPTWQNLTALEYHFATQCLPGPLAWHVQQLHPLLLRLSVAATILIEIPAAYLLLVSGTISKIGAVLQILLQLMIMLTGNYNFFNLLTIALCLACLETRSSTTKVVNQIQHAATWLFLSWSCSRMFSLETHQETWNVSMKFTKADSDALSDKTLSLVTVVCLAFALWKGAQHAVRKRSVLGAIHTLVCVVAIGVTAVPLLTLTRPLQQRGFWGSKQIFEPLSRSYLQPYRLSNGFGLFRRMTGVGTLVGTGWAGQPPSVVTRPEIILEGLLEGDNEWTELSFRWKPGDERGMPRQIAPHQPRLDWQMWFAALGNPQSNLWFLNLIQKLLDNCHPVQHLVGDLNLLSGRKLVKVRAKLYHYDFTRLETEWNRGIPGVQLVNTTDWTRDLFQRPEQYWQRHFSRMYLDEIARDDPGLAQHLSRYGYSRFCDTKRNCRDSWCHATFLIRKFNFHLIPILLLCVYLFHQGIIRHRTARKIRKKKNE